MVGLVNCTLDRCDNSAKYGLCPLSDEIVHGRGMDHAIRLDLHVVFDVVCFGVVDSRGWMEIVVFVEWINANGRCHHLALIRERWRRLKAGVHDSVFRGILRGGAFPAVSRDHPTSVSGTSKSSGGVVLQCTA